MLVEVPWQFDKLSNGTRPDFMDAFCDCVMGALKLPRTVEHSQKSKLPYYVRYFKVINPGWESGKLVSVRHLRGRQTSHGGQAMQRTYGLVARSIVRARAILLYSALFCCSRLSYYLHDQYCPPICQVFIDR